MKKRKLLSLILIAAIALLNTTSVFAGSTNPESAKVKTKHFKLNDKYMQVDLQIPVFTGVGKKTTLTRLNKSIEASYINNYKSLHKEAVSYYNDTLKYTDFNFHKYSSTSLMKIHTADSKLVSVAVNKYDYTGGAHGMPEITCYNIDVRTGKDLALKDLFNVGSDYKSRLNKEIAEQIKKLDDPDSYTFESITEAQQFYIENGNLNIVFQSYEIACYAVGQPTFTIPLTKLKDILQVNIK